MNRPTLVFAIALGGMLVPATSPATTLGRAETAAADALPAEAPRQGTASGDVAPPPLQDADGDGTADVASRRRAKGKARHGFGKPASTATMSGPPSDATGAQASAGDPIPDIDITVGVAAPDAAEDNPEARDDASVPALDANPVL